MNRRFAALAGSEGPTAGGVHAGAYDLGWGVVGAGEELKHEMGSDLEPLSLGVLALSLQVVLLSPRAALPPWCRALPTEPPSTLTAPEGR